MTTKAFALCVAIPTSLFILLRVLAPRRRAQSAD